MKTVILICKSISCQINKYYQKQSRGWCKNKKQSRGWCKNKNNHVDGVKTKKQNKIQHI
jgi:hypothetical protein